MSGLAKVELEHLWAKSRRDGQIRGESLVEHTEQVLLRLAELIRLRPELPTILRSPRLWYRLYWACLLHDLGKAAAGFQAVVRGQPHRWGDNHYRHEIGSLAFVHWFFDEAHPDYTWIVAAIASHHKDASQIALAYPPAQTDDDDAVADIAGQFRLSDLVSIQHWLASTAITGRTWPCLREAEVEAWPEPASGLADQFISEASQRIHTALRIYRRFVSMLANEATPDERVATIALRGLIVTADHAGSAHAAIGDRLIGNKHWLVERLTHLAGHSYGLYEHQHASAQQAGTAMLIAPTGSGKTEAALCWALGDNSRRPPRLLYALPYQASMNAMYERLEGLFPKQVGLQHGRALAALYRLLSQADDDQAAARRAAAWVKNLTGLHALPITVFSPYQMLKGLYRLKGYEALLTNLAGSALVFDEIHAYEPARLALILTLTAYLQRHFSVRCFVMSATFPTLVRCQLEAYLGIEVQQVITASPALFTAFRRHRLHLLDGDLLVNGLDDIVSSITDGRSVLVCCNTVQRAQTAYDELVRRLPSTVEHVLIHGRFTIRDRQEKERIIREATGVDSQTRRPIVVVATQVVEVSLNIDLDTIFTDPAPLEALIQRFGRINRRRRVDLADVHVFRQPDDGHGIYDPDVVAGALAIAERVDGQAIDEAAIGDWLNEIYTGQVAERWQVAFDQAAADCERACLRTLRAFDSDEQLEESFYAAFDGIDVLPQSLEQPYLKLLAYDALQAAELLVPISYRQFRRLAHSGRARAGEDGIHIVRAGYSNEMGLMIDD